MDAYLHPMETYNLPIDSYRHHIDTYLHPMDTYRYPIDNYRYTIGIYIQPMDTYIALCTPPTYALWTHTDKQWTPMDTIGWRNRRSEKSVCPMIYVSVHMMSVGVHRVSVYVNRVCIRCL